ncbi:Argininosuccinate synthase [Buchnera aphidicola (Eriosoma grossulariae)]|uniref:argininosuccinate synthase n=1 Tax=Buchnera aphidicola TaxID=9 RepID=UPI003463E3F0
MNKKKTNKVVLAYSGGLDTSAIIPWIKENYNLSVIAFVANVGQNKEDLEGIEEKALVSGADEVYIVDLREEFLCNYIYPVVHTGATYEGNYLLGTSMARPIIAKAQVDLAIKLEAKFLCHGATGKGNDQVRFEIVYAALAPELKVIAPWREWNFYSREDLLTYLKTKNISTTSTIEKIYSRDDNIWHTSTEGGILENPWNEPLSNCWIKTVDPCLAPNEPESVSIKIEKGIVVSVNQVKMNPLQCLEKLNELGSKHSIGRIDIVENRLIGIKSRGCYETPGGTIIMKAIRAIEELVLDRDSIKWRLKLALDMSYIVYDGCWFSPYRESLQAAIKVLVNYFYGEIVLKLYKGMVTVVQKKSIHSLYSQKFSTFGKDDEYLHSDAAGFIRLFSLPSRIRALHQKKNIKDN